MASRDLFGQLKGERSLVQDMAGMGLMGLCALLPPKKEISSLLAFSQLEGLSFTGHLPL